MFAGTCLRTHAATTSDWLAKFVVESWLRLGHNGSAVLRIAYFDLIIGDNLEISAVFDYKPSISNHDVQSFVVFVCSCIHDDDLVVPLGRQIADVQNTIGARQIASHIF